jgi:S1-C subfamily serine protease
MLGGALVVGALAGVLIASGGLDSSGMTVTVQRTPILFSSQPTAARSAGDVAASVYARAATGVVFVNASGVTAPRSAGEFLKGEGGERSTATGSGFEIDGQGTILTNWHVVSEASKITVTLDHGRTVSASVIAKNPSTDIAVLRIPTGGLVLHPLALGDSSAVQVGESVFAIGNPFGLAETLTTGVISSLQRQITAPNGATITGALQTDAPIDPGSSGGPLLNEQGEVIGINSQIETTGEHGGNVGIAFAIPIDTVKGELAALERG